MLSKIAKQALRVTFSAVPKTNAPATSAVFQLNTEAGNTAVQQQNLSSSELQ